MKRVLYIIIAVIVIQSVFAACGQGTAPQNIALAVVVGKHANSYSFTDEDYGKVRDLMKRAFKTTEGYSALGNISVIVSDGNPKTEAILDQAGRKVSLKIDVNSAKMRDETIKKRIEQAIMPFIRGEYCRAADEENDLLGSIAEAALNIRNNPDSENHIVIMDSGITTAGHFNMLNIDVQTARNEDIIENLNAYGVIPDLSGINISFFGLGNVAPPQEIRDPKLRGKLVDLWTRIIESGNGKLTAPIRYSPMGTDPMEYYESGEGYPYVSVVQFSDFSITITGSGDGGGQLAPAPSPAASPLMPATSQSATLQPATPQISFGGANAAEELKIDDAVKEFYVTGNELSARTLGFKPNSSDYRNEITASKNLEDSMRLLRMFFSENPTGKVYIVGSEASGVYGRENTGNLSWKRAEKVGQTLLALLGKENIQSNNLVFIGTGDKLPWRFEPEFSDGGNRRNEDVCEKNRSVWIIPETAENKVSQLYNAGFINSK